MISAIRVSLCVSFARVVAIITHEPFHQERRTGRRRIDMGVGKRNAEVRSRRDGRLRASRRINMLAVMSGSSATRLARPRRLLFVQGGGRGAHAYDAPLASSLRDALGAGWTVDYPRISNEGEPSVPSWGPQLDRLLSRLGPRGVVVAHSIGATLLVNQLL